MQRGRGGGLQGLELRAAGLGYYMQKFLIN